MAHWCRAVLLLAATCCVYATISKDTEFVLIHVTDVHGWIAGHPHNETLNADFGDFASLMEHLHVRTSNEGKQLLLFDSGDIIEGTGISDATTVHGQYIFPVVKLVKNYTALTIGNHDIGHTGTVSLMKKTFIPEYNDQSDGMEGTYLTANSFMRSAEAPHDAANPLGKQYTITRTPGGIDMMIIGWLFNFTLPAYITDVDTVAYTLEQPWFQQAMKEAYSVDIIFLPMHIDPQSTPEMQQIVEAIRSVHPNIAIGVLAGHRHRQYWHVLDANAFVIESGKYFESLGIVTFTLTTNGDITNLDHQWMPTSRENFYDLAGTTKANFPTETGLKIKDMIAEASEALHLNVTLGCSPLFYDPDVSFHSPNSFYRLYVDQIMPKAVFNASLQATQFFITNSAALRYYMYEGRVSVNDIWTISPFRDQYQYYPNMPGSVLRPFLSLLNSPDGKMAAKMAGRTPFRTQVSFDEDDDTDENLPSYFWTEISIDDNGTYDVLMSQYDADSLKPLLQENFPQYHAWYEVYPTVYTSTSALAEFVVRQFPCSSSCPC